MTPRHDPSCDSRAQQTAPVGESGSSESGHRYCMDGWMDGWEGGQCGYVCDG